MLRATGGRMQLTQTRVAPTGDPAELADSFVWIRADTLTLLLRAVGVLVWFAILPYSRHPEGFWPGWGTLTALGTLIVVCYALRVRSYRLASGLFVAGLFVGATAFLVGSPQAGAVLFVFVPVVLIAGVLRAAR